MCLLIQLHRSKIYIIVSALIIALNSTFKVKKVFKVGEIRWPENVLGDL
jgi:hypothetical protein